MEERVTTVQGLPLAMYERHGKKPAIFFVHGSSSNAHAFEKVWDDPALADYHLIALDLPGHGRSDFTKDVRCYTISFLGKLIAEIIDRNNLLHAILAGHSIGGHIALSVLNFSSHIAGIALAGAAPLSSADDLPRAYIISDAVQTVFKGEASEAEIHSFANNAVHRKDKVDLVIRAFKETDKLFREETGLELGRHFKPESFSSELQLLKRTGVPVCLLHGSQEKVVRLDHLQSVDGLNLFGGKVHLVAEAGHGLPFEAPEAYSRILGDFAADLSVKLADD